MAAAGEEGSCRHARSFLRSTETLLMKLKHDYCLGQYLHSSEVSFRPPYNIIIHRRLSTAKLDLNTLENAVTDLLEVFLVKDGVIWHDNRQIRIR